MLFLEHVVALKRAYGVLYGGPKKDLWGIVCCLVFRRHQVQADCRHAPAMGHDQPVNSSNVSVDFSAFFPSCCLGYGPGLLDNRPFAAHFATLLGRNPHRPSHGPAHGFEGQDILFS